VHLIGAIVHEPRPVSVSKSSTPVCRVRLGNMVDPKYALGASILKSYL